MPKDIKGKKRMLGVFDHDADYKEFVTQGAKKYAYRDKKHRRDTHYNCRSTKTRCKSIEKFRRI